MIAKFKTIENLAVFQNFHWDTLVKEKNGSIKEFKDINIFYGRNYSGKTTLSRIVRALELGELSNKYEDPDFTVVLKDDSEINYNNLAKHNEKVRVFNEDFVRENLKFIIDPESSIEPFAILGEDNKNIELEIKKLEEEVGINEEGYETGLYKELRDAQNLYNQKYRQKEKARNSLEKQLKDKATDRKTGIKYNSDKFGNQNYDIRHLEKDINKILTADFQSITNEKQKELERLIEEKTLNFIPELKPIELNFFAYLKKAKELVEKPVSQSDKIEELVKDAMLNKWVKEGRKLHKGERDTCGFCGNPITANRWEQLENHFDEESEKLEKDIDNLIENIEEEKKLINNAFKPDKNHFYSKFHQELEKLMEKYNTASQKYHTALNILTKQLKQRKEDIINNFKFEVPGDFSAEIINILDSYEILRNKANEFTASLEQKQKEAKESLRLQEVSDFLSTIQYKDQKKKIKELEDQVKTAKTNKDKIYNTIQKKESTIEFKKRELNDEEKGAKKVNEYLNNFFGHEYISLQALEKEKDEGKNIRFEVIRDNKKAYHLSEGECSLLAFCYFIAKLEDTKTEGSKPIIWIDDPVSSLDGNHIFFIYSLLKSEIVDRKIFKQLFVSTHSLDFLKYLKRLGRNEYKNAYFLVNRKDKISELLPMPKYLKEYITEFNYLFEQIFRCSKIDRVDDSNYTLFYNFGNNARKFLEIFLFYKYPDLDCQTKKMEKFFGANKVPAILTDRINNEYSHLFGVLERGGFPVQVPEMNSTAKLILKRIKELDKEQYKSLMSSIGEEDQNT